MGFRISAFKKGYLEKKAAIGLDGEGSDAPLTMEQQALQNRKTQSATTDISPTEKQLIGQLITPEIRNATRRISSDRLRNLNMPSENIPAANQMLTAGRPGIGAKVGSAWRWWTGAPATAMDNLSQEIETAWLEDRKARLAPFMSNPLTAALNVAKHTPIWGRSYSEPAIVDPRMGRDPMSAALEYFYIPGFRSKFIREWSEKGHGTPDEIQKRLLDKNNEGKDTDGMSAAYIGALTKYLTQTVLPKLQTMSNDEIFNIARTGRDRADGLHLVAGEPSTGGKGFSAATQKQMDDADRTKMYSPILPGTPEAAAREIEIATNKAKTDTGSGVKKQIPTEIFQDPGDKSKADGALPVATPPSPDMVNTKANSERMLSNREAFFKVLPLLSGEQGPWTSTADGTQILRRDGLAENEDLRGLLAQAGQYLTAMHQNNRRSAVGVPPSATYGGTSNRGLLPSGSAQRRGFFHQYDENMYNMMSQDANLLTQNNPNMLRNIGLAIRDTGALEGGNSFGNRAARAARLAREGRNAGRRGGEAGAPTDDAQIRLQMRNPAAAQAREERAYLRDYSDPKNKVKAPATGTWKSTAEWAKRLAAGPGAEAPAATPPAPPIATPATLPPPAENAAPVPPTPPPAVEKVPPRTPQEINEAYDASVYDARMLAGQGTPAELADYHAPAVEIPGLDRPWPTNPRERDALLIAQEEALKRERANTQERIARSRGRSTARTVSSAATEAPVPTASGTTPTVPGAQPAAANKPGGAITQKPKPPRQTLEPGRFTSGVHTGQFGGSLA